METDVTGGGGGARKWGLGANWSQRKAEETKTKMQELRKKDDSKAELCKGKTIQRRGNESHCKQNPPYVSMQNQYIRAAEKLNV